MERVAEGMAPGTLAVVGSHGAAIRLVSAVLAGVDSGFALDHHLAAPRELLVQQPLVGVGRDRRWQRDDARAGGR